MVDECMVLGARGHLWRKQGTYLRRDEDKPVQRWQCGACGKTTTRRRGRPMPLHRKPGRQRGHTIQSVGGLDAFWEAVAENVVQVGLHESVRMAAGTVGVHSATAHRWLKARDRIDSARGVEGKLLSGALEAAADSRVEIPAVLGRQLR